ncbi:hypothetical protein RJ639_030301 [Escallonia herrerae]|uniref:ABC1 atypical kinase-like domain-containing protein n=1 Tax=Escallonia herrerae TaxID=1293975 RepID=A0AA88X3X7_9ASTE|nr:hypothetical protein RJ639_030301 [Escallonia herrerae]
MPFRTEQQRIAQETVALCWPLVHIAAAEGSEGVTRLNPQNPSLQCLRTLAGVELKLNLNSLLFCFFKSSLEKADLPSFIPTPSFPEKSTLIFQEKLELCIQTPPTFLAPQAYNYFYKRPQNVHGEKPSAAFAKSRKESLESVFGHMLISSSKSSSMFYHFGPFLALYRAAVISFHALQLTISHFFLHDIKKRSIKDQIPPFSTRVAIKSIESQLGVPISQIFADISLEPIAAASLGQVYKAHLHSGELVAVKVQRPGMSVSLTLDALLFQMIGGQLKRFAKAWKHLLVAVNEMAQDPLWWKPYEGVSGWVLYSGENFVVFHEASSTALWYDEAFYIEDKKSSHSTAHSNVDYQDKNCVKVPKIYWNLTRKAVLTMEWIDGIKLTDEAGISKACLNRKELIDQGLYCSLRQLLEVGFFHAVPHPGNLVATKDGSLAYFDFGMIGEIPRHFRVGLIQVDNIKWINRRHDDCVKGYTRFRTKH